jgi:hypothetical protein
MLNFFNHLFRLNDLQLSVSPSNKSSLKQGEDYEEAYPEERYYEEAGEDEWDIEPRAGGYHKVSRALVAGHCLGDYRADEGEG